MQQGENQWKLDVERGFSNSPPTLATAGTAKEEPEPSSLAEVFGYFEGSKSNTMALVQRVSNS